MQDGSKLSKQCEDMLALAHARALKEHCDKQGFCRRCVFSGYDAEGQQECKIASYDESDEVKLPMDWEV